MTLYQELQKDLFNWLKSKNDTDPSFTFSVRQRNKVGSELNYFIGTETSGYFSTTFWFIPVAYPGSAGDLINLVIDLRKVKDGFTYYLQFNQTKNPPTEQNRLALEFIQSIKPEVRNSFPHLFYESSSENKMEFFKIDSPKAYHSFKEAIPDLQSLLDQLFLIINRGIYDFKKKQPSFIANRFTPDNQTKMFNKMNNRFSKAVPELTQPVGKNDELSISKSNEKKPLNQILFGAPGTGKTYSTKKLAVEIIENRQFGSTKEDREEILRLYDQYYELNQIRFTTFHQSLGYEDFIEGIKPIVEEDENGRRDVLYEVQEGILKKIASDARKKKYANHQQAEYSFDDAWNDLLKDVDEALKNNSNVFLDIQTPGMGMKVLAITDRGNLLVKPSLSSEDSNKYTVSYTRAKKLQKAFPDLSIVKNIDKEFRQVIGGSNSTAYWSVMNFINKKIEEASSSQTHKTELAAVPYVLIMDEINRGNISSIFGELITLIEDDKRLGSKESIEVILPYSKENFGVPPNLYLIGTMNTADRSVEALDTALRRRFSFTEMKSNPQVLLTAHENGGMIPETNINLISLLETINKRIELLVDKDHQIGHSYFISVNSLDDLKYTFKNKIIPLLEEYFYGDFGKIGLVLGDRFVTASAAHENKKILANFKGYDDVDFLTDKKIYEFSDIEMMNSSDFISIYQPVSVSANNES